MKVFFILLILMKCISSIGLFIENHSYPRNNKCAKAFTIIGSVTNGISFFIVCMLAYAFCL